MWVEARRGARRFIACGGSADLPPAIWRNPPSSDGFGDDIGDHQIGIMRDAEMHANVFRADGWRARKGRLVREGEDGLRTAFGDAEVRPARDDRRVERLVCCFFRGPSTGI